MAFAWVPVHADREDGVAPGFGMENVAQCLGSTETATGFLARPIDDGRNFARFAEPPVDILAPRAFDWACLDLRFAP